MTSKRRTHGERNQDLSKELLNGQLYYDWVITTAFYSAIHVVEDKILPCNIRGHTCNNIVDVKNAYKMNGRHSSRERLVSEHLPGISNKYKWLDDQSRYSRYISYKVQKNQAEKAIQYLNEIFIACSLV